LKKVSVDIKASLSNSTGNVGMFILQHLKLLLFHRFLKSVRDFADENRVWDESEAMAQEALAADYRKLICKTFGHMI
jgi:hypothetical protein